MDYKIARYILSYQIFGNPNPILIGELKDDIKGHITLTIYNAFLYSGFLHLLFEFERKYELTFERLIQLDVCCDVSNDLPRKLNAIMHDKRCEVTRRGKKKSLTEKGNQYLGKKVSENIKMLTDKREYGIPTFYYELKTTGCRKPTILRCYNKTEEVKKKSEKFYILNQYSFSPVYRMEVSIECSELTNLSKSSQGWSQQYIYEHISDKKFLSEIFKYYLNRFATLKIEGRKYSITEYLRLE